jgi:hypothetical protein
MDEFIKWFKSKYEAMKNAFKHCNVKPLFVAGNDVNIIKGFWKGRNGIIYKTTISNNCVYYDVVILKRVFPYSKDFIICGVEENHLKLIK